MTTKNAEEAERASPFSSCEVEVQKNYFGARQVKGKHGRRAAGKTKVFGIYQAQYGSVYTENCPAGLPQETSHIIQLEFNIAACAR